MSSIKLGNKTLGNISFGSTKIGDARRLAKAPIFRTEALKNHVNKVVTYVPKPQPTQPQQETQWLLSNGVWNDNGVWDDSQTWTE
jgi:hypothetical protein